MHELELERPELHRLAGREILEVGFAEVVLVEFGARHRDRQRAAVDGRRVLGAELAQDPRQGAEMILVAVRDHDRLDLVRPGAQVREVRQHEVDPELLGGREPQARVDDDDPVLVLDDRHVLPDLAEPAERQDPQLSVAHTAIASASTVIQPSPTAVRDARASRARRPALRRRARRRAAAARRPGPRSSPAPPSGCRRRARSRGRDRRP